MAAVPKFSLSPALARLVCIVSPAVVCLLLAVGCRPAVETEVAAVQPPPSGASTAGDALPQQRARPAPAAETQRRPLELELRRRPPSGPRTLADLLEGPDPAATGGATPFDHPKHDDAKLATAGVRKIGGRRLTVYTDLPVGDVDDFPRVFEAAAGQWGEYFSLTPAKLDGWRMTAYVIDDKALFRRVGLLPDDLPLFQHGYQRGHELWVYEQPSDYYRRHLLLHEGTHGVMNTLLGGAGPPWYMEGVAELLAAHHWDGEKLLLRYNPRDRAEAPYWGRVKIINDDFAGDRGLRLAALMQYDARAHQNVEAYAWSWAACNFFDRRTETQAAFRGMQAHVRLPAVDFNRRFHDQLADQWNRLEEDWYLYVSQLDYGSDVERTAVVHRQAQPPPADGAVVSVQPGRGWQSSGVRIDRGRQYRLQAAGRFQIAVDQSGAAWPCEAGGVTLRYVDGRPAGRFAVRSARRRPGADADHPAVPAATCRRAKDIHRGGRRCALLQGQRFSRGTRRQYRRVEGQDHARSRCTA